MENNKLLKLLFENIIFFSIFYLTGHLLLDFRIMKICIYLILIVIISYRNIRYLRAFKSSKLKFSLLFVLGLSIIYELSKTISFNIGILPRYDETPFFIGYMISLSCIVIYYLLLLIVNYIIEQK